MKSSLDPKESVRRLDSGKKDKGNLSCPSRNGTPRALTAFAGRFPVLCKGKTWKSLWLVFAKYSQVHGRSPDYDGST